MRSGLYWAAVGAGTLGFAVDVAEVLSRRSPEELASAESYDDWWQEEYGHRGA